MTDYRFRLKICFIDLRRMELKIEHVKIRNQVQRSRDMSQNVFVGLTHLKMSGLKISYLIVSYFFRRSVKTKREKNSPIKLNSPWNLHRIFPLVCVSIIQIQCGITDREKIVYFRRCENRQRKRRKTSFIQLPSLCLLL